MINLEQTSKGRFKLVDEEVIEDSDGIYEVHQTFEGTEPITITTDGSGCWDCEAGREVDVFGVRVEYRKDEGDDEGYYHFVVNHGTTWDIYSDSGFSQGLSKLVGFGIGFTEQGMQADEYASMEPYDDLDTLAL